MSLPFNASAPGKLMLCGEYAVLYGAPAIATAVGPRAIVGVSRSTDSTDQLLTPGLSGRQRRFSRDASGAIHWADGDSDPDLQLFQTLLETTPTASEYGSGDCPLRFTLDTRSFWSGSRKLGLGSSAALSVALQALLQRLSGSSESALRAHRSFQSGLGSGADLAVCEAGGVQSFQRMDDAAVTRSLAWPSGLLALVIDTGTSQSTPTMISRLREWLANDSAGERSLQRLVASAEAAAAAFESSAADFLTEATAFANDLQALDQAAGIGIYSGGHERIRALAAGSGVVYKPSGAGGGDIGIAFSDEPASIDAFRSACVNAGFHSLDIELAAEGLTVT